MAASDLLPTIAPEIPNGSYAAWVGLAQGQLNLSVWPAAKADMATALLAAHLYTRLSGSSGKGQAGAVIEQQVGQLRETFAAPKSDDDFLTTRYGKLYLKLRSTVMFTPLPI